VAISIQDKDRDVIPRWRSFGRTLANGEMRPLSNTTTPFFDENRLEKAANNWKENRTIAFAGELLSAVIVLNVKQDSVEDAASFILESNAPESTKDIARRLRGESIVSPFSDEFPEHNAWIRQLRAYLSANPRDPFAWVDFALGYTATGNHDKAKRAMNVALNLAGNNRFVLRSAARFYVHLDDYIKANDIIRRSEVSKSDPWLISAELATSAAAERRPQFAKIGQKMAASMSLSPFHTSELHAALGMLEMESGSNKKAKRNFVAALQKPTENTVAQVNFAVRRDKILSITELELHKLISAEALTYEKYKSGDWRGSLHESLNWFHDQPFSIRPALHGTYLTACVLEDYEECQRIATLGLRANPNEFGLLNNLSVALARSGDVSKAFETFKKIKTGSLDDCKKITYLATAGMINYRLGHQALGEQYYLQSISGAKKIREPKMAIRANLFHYREKIDTGLSVDRKAIADLEKQIGDDNDTLAVLQNLKKKL